jgi:hypothetical protein
VIDLKELELIIFHKEELQIIELILHLHKLEEFLEGEAFDEMIESLTYKHKKKV